jgi:hypothetical protein
MAEVFILLTVLKSRYLSLIFYRVDEGLWTVLDVTGRENYTFVTDLLFYGQVWELYFWGNDTAGNSLQTPLLSFTIVDTGTRLFSVVNQTNPTPEYNDFNLAFIEIEEPAGSSGIDTALLYYSVDGGPWIKVDVTGIYNFTFEPTMLNYNQTYNWYFWLNDTAGNTNKTALFSFKVTDRTSPLYSHPSQTNYAPEYNGANTVSITGFEPDDASGLDCILLYYCINGGPWISIDTNLTGSFIFTEDLLEFGNTYEWYFWLNDTVGNENQTNYQTFAITDIVAPTFSNLYQANETVEYDESFSISVIVSEPEDASGLDCVLLYYRVDNGSWTEIDVTALQNFTFIAEMLRYGQEYRWYFWFNDSAGNWDQTPEKSFTVVDRTAPTVLKVQQTSMTPEYSENNTVSVVLNEPADASGIQTVLLYYQLNNGSLKRIDVSSSHSYTFPASLLRFNEVYFWFFWFNDTQGNWNTTSFQAFSVIDKTPPTSTIIIQTSDRPEYDDFNNISTIVIEPSDASGVDQILFFYRLGNQSWQTAIVTNEGSFIFNASILAYGQIWEWYFWFNDTQGNWNRTTSGIFEVWDFTPPTISKVSQARDLISGWENQTVSLAAFEPTDASGLDYVLLSYSEDNVEWSFINVTNTLNYTFDGSQLRAGTYYWYFWIFDKAGNDVKTPINSFSVESIEEERTQSDYGIIFPLALAALLGFGGTLFVNQRLSKSQSRFRKPTRGQMLKWGVLIVLILSVIVTGLSGP